MILQYRADSEIEDNYSFENMWSLSSRNVATACVVVAEIIWEQMSEVNKMN